MTSLEFWSLVPDYLTAIAAIAAFFVAWLGVDTWRRQLIGQHEYDCARRLMKNAYEWERTLKRLRLPFDNPIELEKMLDEYGSELDVAFLEGRVHWGDSFFKLKQPILDCANKWSLSKKQLERFCNRENPNPRDDQEYDRLSPIVNMNSDDGSDEFSKQIRAAVAGLEEFVRPHLRQ